MELAKTLKALIDGLETVRHREPLVVPREDFISTLFTKIHPIHIFVAEDERSKEIKPNAIGMYLTSSFVAELINYPIILILYSEGFDAQDLMVDLCGVLIFEDEYVDFKLKACFELSAVFKLIKNRSEEGAEA